MKEKRGMVLKYTAKGKTISRSAHHPGLWVIDYDGGGFSTINTTQEDMLRMNPPDHIMIKYLGGIKKFPAMARKRSWGKLNK